MRSQYSVYKKLRELKYAHIVVLYRKYLRRNPENCGYNKPYKFRSEDGTEYELRLCILHQGAQDESQLDLTTIDVCQEMEHCQRCNAFVPAYTKERVHEIFEQELSNQKLKAKKYPDICALEWVLERSVIGIPPFNWIQKIYYAIKKLLTRNRVL